jgi:ferredoxin
MEWMPKKGKKPPRVDIFEMLEVAEKRKKKKRREEILAPLGAKEFFAEGSIAINKKTCEGVACKLCIKACPTSALFWKAGEIGLTEDLCIYCGACVLSCIVDDCIKITRKRFTGEVETFSKPRDFIARESNINAKKRLERIKEAFPDTEEYIKRRKKKPP